MYPWRCIHNIHINIRRYPSFSECSFLMSLNLPIIPPHLSYFSVFQLETKAWAEPKQTFINVWCGNKKTVNKKLTKKIRKSVFLQTGFYTTAMPLETGTHECSCMAWEGVSPCGVLQWLRCEVTWGQSLEMWAAKAKGQVMDEPEVQSIWVPVRAMVVTKFVSKDARIPNHTEETPRFYQL